MTTTTILSDNGVSSGITGYQLTGGNDGTLQLQTTTAGGTATTAITVDTSQNVGIGTGSPDAKLTLKNPSVTNEQIVFDVHGATNTTKLLYASVNQSTDVNSFGTGYGAPLAFVTNSTERARIDSNGNLLVGKTAQLVSTVGAEITTTGIRSTIADSTNASLTYAAYSSTAAAYRFYVGFGGTVYATNTTITSISDQRLKENIRDLDDGLEKLMSLKPRKFDWKEGKGQDIKNARGFIAQEFETVFPDMVEEWKDPAPNEEAPYKAINANLIPTLVKAIQEQQALITQLQADVAALKGQA